MTNKTARASTASDIRSRVDVALAKVNARQNLLIAADELWDQDQELQAELEPCRGYIAALIDLADYRTCPSPDLHRREWRYIQHGFFVCDLCARLQREVNR